MYWNLLAQLFRIRKPKKDITLSGVFFWVIAGFRLWMVVGDAIADLRFSERIKEAEMSEQSLFRRSAPYKPYSGSKKRGSMSNVGV